MDCHDYIIEEPERKRGQHLGQARIQHLKKQGYSLREIAQAINLLAKHGYERAALGNSVTQNHVWHCA